MMKSKVGFSTDFMDPQKIIDGFKANPLTQQLWHFIEPTLLKILPTLLEEQRQLIAKANDRLEAMADQPVEKVEAVKEKYRVNIITHLQRRCREVVSPVIKQVVLSNSDKPMTVSPQLEEMAKGLLGGQVSDEFVKEAGSLVKSVVSTISQTSNTQAAEFIEEQLKYTSSNFSMMIREEINKFILTKTFDPKLRFDREKMREILTTIFMDELSEQCKLLGKGVNSEKSSLTDKSKDLEDSEEKLLEVTLCFTDEKSSSYKVITEAAKQFSVRGPDLSASDTHQLMTKTHLAVHQALEKDATEYFEDKSPRSAKNRYFCRWVKEEDVTFEGRQLYGAQ